MSRRIIGTTNQLIRVKNPSATPAVGGWLSTEPGGSGPLVRDRIGKNSAVALFGTGNVTSSMTRQDRVLSPKQLWLIYQRTPDVRAAVDQIARQISTWDWNVEPTLDPKDPGYEQALVVAEAQKDFLKQPNFNGDTWQEFLFATVLDLLVFDAGAVEIVSDKGMIQELVPLRGSEIRPIVTSEHGQLVGYQQDIYSSSVIVADNDKLPVFLPHQLLYLQMTRNTASPEGIPLIESIVDQVVSILRAAERAMQTLDSSQIPPGLLALAGISGDAAIRAKADFQNLAGQDHKIRVMTTPDPTGVAATWIQLQNTPKEIDMMEIVDRIQRTIWRVFGVMPVEMGSEDSNRAHATVQLEVSSSHLVNPILELVQAKINNIIIPQLTPQHKLIKFVFIKEPRLTQAEKREQAGSHAQYVKQGVMTRNEVRAAIMLPPIPYGDIATVEIAGIVVPLERIMVPIDAPENPEDVPSAKDPEDGGPDPGNDGADDADDAVEKAVHLLETRLHSHTDVRANFDLPSAWQPRGRFKDVRTLRLDRLWDAVSSYTGAVLPLWDQAHADSLLAARRALGPDGIITPDEATRLYSEFSAIIDKLSINWSISTSGFYLSAVMAGKHAAEDFTGVPVVAEPRSVADLYQAQAMSYLAAAEGPLSALRIKMLSVVSDAVRKFSARATELVDDLDVDGQVMMAGITAAWQSQEHRIENWSGRLVELANKSLRTGMLEGSSLAGPDGPVSTEWWAEWVDVGDKRECATCIEQASLGFRPLNSFTTMPGGDTECRGRDRCVIVLWTKREVENKTAISLAGQVG